MQDRVSVVLPYFNRRETLADAALSVLAQTYEDLLLFLVDDGSTDDSQEIARGLGDPRIVHVRLARNSGASEARNAGLERAEDSLVAFMDSDDLWLPEKISVQVRLLRAWQAKDPTVAAIGCGSRQLGSAEADRTLAEGPFSRRQFLRGNVAGTGTPMLMIDRNVAEHARFDPSFPAFEEGDYLLKCLSNGRKLVIAPDTLACVRRGRSDHVANPSSAAAGYERLLATYEEEYAEEPEARSWFNFQACRQYLAVREYRKALALVPASLAHGSRRRAVHLLCGVLAGRRGLAAIQALLPVVRSETD